MTENVKEGSATHFLLVAEQKLPKGNSSLSHKMVINNNNKKTTI